MADGSVDRDVVEDYVWDYLDESGLDDCDYDVEWMVEEMADFMEANGIGSCYAFSCDVFKEMSGAYEY